MQELEGSERVVDSGERCQCRRVLVGDLAARGADRRGPIA